MSGEPNTLFLRLEGPLQAWGANSKFMMRRTMEAPTKSGVLGLICCAKGLGREEAGDELKRLNTLVMGVRVDHPGILWSDYHTVGAGTGMLTAQGRHKEKGVLLTRRDYLCDASFLVVLKGDPGIVREAKHALAKPAWPLYLGRKACPPSLPIIGRSDEQDTGVYDSLEDALGSRLWRPRPGANVFPADGLVSLLEWRSSAGEPFAPDSAEIWDDSPVLFDPPVHRPRFVVRKMLQDVPKPEEEDPLMAPTPLPARPRAGYHTTDYKNRRKARLDQDQGLCVFCKCEAGTVQHITYRHVNTEQEAGDLRSLCRLCHDAVTMIEYGLGMGMDRINPEDPCWREAIIQKREDIIRFRSLATRRRRLSPEEVE